MTESEIGDIIESGDPNIDIAAIMAEIRTRIQHRRAETESRDAGFQRVAEGRISSVEAGQLTPVTYEALERMRRSYDKITVGLSLTENRTPLIGPLVQRMRHALHGLILYYVNMLAGRQMRFNDAVIRALGGLVATLDESEDPWVAIDTLRTEISARNAEIAVLQERVAALEARLQDSSDHPQVCH